MSADQRDLGYAIYSRLEEAIRYWLQDRLLAVFGEQWQQQIPKAIYDRLANSQDPITSECEPCVFLDRSEFSDLKQIITFNGGYKKLVSTGNLTQGRMESLLDKGYELRCKIAHVNRYFSTFDLATLIDLTKEFLPVLDVHGLEVGRIVDIAVSSPEKISISIPLEFLQLNSSSAFVNNNLPSGDYRSDGGFVGRAEDSKKIQQMLLSNLDRVITISGAGGVGKTALAHYTCTQILEKEKRFDAIVWISAKEQVLTVSGIEDIEPTLHNYEDVLDSILQTLRWTDELQCLLSEKEEWVNLALNTGDRGILLVIDNLETVQDEQVMDFVKNVPHPNKVLITSRMGLGEVERRYPLKELLPQDAVALFRTVAREKGVESLAKLPNDVLLSYVQRMSNYPLAIKWIIGQVALGREINSSLVDLTSPDGDVAAFCFEHIFDRLLDDRCKMVLYALAAYERPVSQGILSHLTNFSNLQLDEAMRHLVIASLVVPNHSKRADSTIETRYELLPLTQNYLQSRLQQEPEVRRGISSRLQSVNHLIEEGTSATQQYRYNLKDLGAVTEEEKIAAACALNAYTRYQSGDYDGAVKGYERAMQIAPQFAAIYRNWARMESDAGYNEKADGLLKKAAQLSPTDPTIWFVWANVETQRGAYDSAFTYFTKALELGPQESPILSAFGELEKRRENFKHAHELLSLALAHAEQTHNQRQQLLCYTALADNHRRWAEKLFKQRHLDDGFKLLWQAEAWASDAIKIDPQDERSQHFYRKINLELGLALRKQKGDLKKAERHFLRALAATATQHTERRSNAIAHYNLACIYFQNRDIALAKKHHSLGLRIVPNPIAADYEALAADLAGDRITAKLLRIIPGRGFGLLECPDDPTQLIFLHINDISPRMTQAEFEGLRGSNFDFVQGFDKDGRRKAKMARLHKSSASTISKSGT